MISMQKPVKCESDSYMKFCTSVQCFTNSSLKKQDRWYREVSGKLIPLEASALAQRAQLLAGGLLRLRGLRREDSAHLVCWLNNTVGGEAVHYSIAVTEPIAVRMIPEVLQTEINADATVECKISGHPVDVVYWVHDGKTLTHSDRVQTLEEGRRLHIKNLRREDDGIYQCFVSNSKEQAYATAELIFEVAEGGARGAGNRSRRAPHARGPRAHDSEWNFTGNREGVFKTIFCLLCRPRVVTDVDSNVTESRLDRVLLFGISIQNLELDFFVQSSTLSMLAHDPYDPAHMAPVRSFDVRAGHTRIL
ncbi:Roundabout homolog 2 [Eumeta japonica]|uniref:Roundabout homolog 2 n=1 Tax=Eumeta variegata TaxID=151549 RepID=A0A4C1X989_EUMVA|nr:Roundabout homolog 2 [Eumeta japonica]